jgi:hypothetical protein
MGLGISRLSRFGCSGRYCGLVARSRALRGVSWNLKLDFTPDARQPSIQANVLSPIYR